MRLLILLWPNIERAITLAYSFSLRLLKGILAYAFRQLRG